MKTKIIFYALAALFVLSISSCKKSDPVQAGAPGNQPVFTFSANLNGAPVSLNAGVNNYYMYTSYTQDANNVYNFTGDLKPYGCTSNCTNSLQIIVNDYQSLATGASANINTSLVPGYYALQIPGGTVTQYSIAFTSYTYNVAAQAWAWDFGDGTTSNLQSPTHIYTHPGNYTTCLTTTFANLTTQSLCKPVYLGTPKSGINATFTYTATVNSISFTSNASGGGPYYYLWDFGDGNTSTLANPTNNYTAPGLYNVSLTVTNAQNQFAVFNRHCQTQSYTQGVMGFYYLPGPTITNPNSLSNVTINWTDAAGTVYTSDNASQPSTSYFQVTAVSPYSSNSSGQTTKKVQAQLKCTLYNGSNTITLDNGNVAFGLAYH